MADGQQQQATTTSLEGLSLGERIVLAARMAVAAHLMESSAALTRPYRGPQRQVVIGGAGARFAEWLPSQARHG